MVLGEDVVETVGVGDGVAEGDGVASGVGSDVGSGARDGLGSGEVVGAGPVAVAGRSISRTETAPPRGRTPLLTTKRCGSAWGWSRRCHRTVCVSSNWIRTSISGTGTVVRVTRS